MLLFERIFFSYLDILIVEKCSLAIRFKHLSIFGEMEKNSFILFNKSYNQNFCNFIFSISGYIYIFGYSGPNEIFINIF